MHNMIKLAAYGVLAALSLPDPGSCKGIDEDCKDDVNASYTNNIFSCTAGAVSLGVVGNVFFGWEGVIFQVGCGANAVRLKNTCLQRCYRAYNNCTVK